MNKAKQKILHNLRNTYCRIKTSGIHGIGVVAVRDIPKGTDVFQGHIPHEWYRISAEDLKTLDKEIVKMIDDFFVIEKDGSVELPESGLIGMDMSFYLNTSDKPNVATSDDGNTFFSIRKIKMGEELTVAYSTFDWKYE